MNVFSLCQIVQNQREDNMDRFFACVCTLMSTQLRECVESSLEELATFFEEYRTGNHYNGIYNILSSPLALPTKPHPITIFLVSSINELVI